MASAAVKYIGTKNNSPLRTQQDQNKIDTAKSRPQSAEQYDSKGQDKKQMDTEPMDVALQVRQQSSVHAISALKSESGKKQQSAENNPEKQQYRIEFNPPQKFELESEAESKWNNVSSQQMNLDLSSIQQSMKTQSILSPSAKDDTKSTAKAATQG